LQQSVDLNPPPFLFLGLSNIRDRQWAIFKCSGLKGWGLEEGLDWLVTTINQANNTSIAITTTPDKKETNSDAINSLNTNNNNNNNSNANNSVPIDNNSPQLPSAAPSENTTNNNATNITEQQQ